MSWFKRKIKGIVTPTSEKKDIPKGLWYKTPSGKIVDKEVLIENLYVSPEDDYHMRIGSEEYFQIFFDDGKYEELWKEMKSKDPLKFQDTQKYTDRVKAAYKKAKLKDAVRVGIGKSKGNDLIIVAMDFTFFGGSMGSAVGEKMTRAMDYAIEHKTPLVLISKSGGARMQEAAISLMQLVKTSAGIARMGKAKVPYISLLTDPTFGGATASFSMLGDINIGEPGALIGFAGPRVIKDTTGKDLPKGFQRSEFLQEHGFLDFIVHRKDIKDQVNLYIDLVLNQPVRDLVKKN